MTVKRIKTTKGHEYVMEFFSGVREVRFDAFDKSGETVINNLTPAEAHEIADWIKDFVPLPPKGPTVREQIDKLATGTQFTVPDSGGSIYTKLTGPSVWASTSGDGVLVDMNRHAATWSKSHQQITVVSAS